MAVIDSRAVDRAFREAAELDRDEVFRRRIKHFFLLSIENGCRAARRDLDRVVRSIDRIVRREERRIEDDAVLDDCGRVCNGEFGRNDGDLRCAALFAGRSEVHGILREFDVEIGHAVGKRGHRKVDDRAVERCICVEGIFDGGAVAHRCNGLDARRIEELAFGLIDRRGKGRRELGDEVVHDAFVLRDLIGDLFAVSDDLIGASGDCERVCLRLGGTVCLGERVTDGHDGVARIFIGNDDGAARKIGSVDGVARLIDDPMGAVCGRRARLRSRVLRAAFGRREARAGTDDPRVFTGDEAVHTAAHAHQRRVIDGAGIDRDDLQGEIDGLPGDEHAVIDVVFARNGSLGGRAARRSIERCLLTPVDGRDRIGKFLDFLPCAAGAGSGAVAVLDPVMDDRDGVRLRNALRVFCGRLFGIDDDLVGAGLGRIEFAAVDVIFPLFQRDGIVFAAVVDVDYQPRGIEGFAFFEFRLCIFGIDHDIHDFPAASAGNEE